GASRWWLHQSLKSLDADLASLGSRLVIRRGASLSELTTLAAETGAKSVVWNRRYEPAVIERDKQIKAALPAEGIEAESFNGALLFEPWTIANKSGKPFQVFTPFWKTCLTQVEPPSPLPTPASLTAPRVWPPSLPLEALELEPRIKWAEGMRTAWTPGSKGAEAHMRRFLREPVLHYGSDRNRPDIMGTSRLSPFLHFGEISPRQVWEAARKRGEGAGLAGKDWKSWQFLTEIGWREFAHHLLYHFPFTPTEPLRSDFKKFPWRSNEQWFRAWRQGQTGYPLVDAGMRELWTTGWMHNRVRMVVASFLVKNLLISWQDGTRWFWDTLVDADLASNTLGWQWTAGCGADAAPYFRIFNPVSQGEKFDALGDYVRRWVPELGRLPSEWIHQPWQAPSGVLLTAGVEVGKTYPEPMVSHAIAREVALEAYGKIRKERAE
ncbi:MAG: deoxyribodipyrimidine photo-lyase, partial [Opitutaceae bacterium]|nr:deoxyribodipyrimidine photo-lyase [Verrucomicrobiales bacterium]